MTLKKFVQADGNDPHECVAVDYCTCRQDADTPDEKCPIHGAGEWPPRCSICGKLMARKQ